MKWIKIHKASISSGPPFWCIPITKDVKGVYWESVGVWVGVVYGHATATKTMSVNQFLVEVGKSEQAYTVLQKYMLLLLDKDYRETSITIPSHLIQYIQGEAIEAAGSTQALGKR